MVGVVVLIWLPDSPVHAHFLTREERIAALERVREDQGGTENKVLKKYQIKEALLDIRTWLVILTSLLSEPKFPSGVCCRVNDGPFSKRAQWRHQQL